MKYILNVGFLWLGDSKLKIYKYKDYDEYVEWQIRTNKSKAGWVYVKESTIRQIVEVAPFASNIICHGTRAGAEQKYFKKFLRNANILGTEISDNATDYPMTIQHDFNMQKPEWIGKFDIVYSNCIDHSIDPKATLKTWSEQLVETGIMCVEYSQRQSIPGGNVNDPLDATLNEIVNLVEEIGMVISNRITHNVSAGGTVLVCKRG